MVDNVVDSRVARFVGLAEVMQQFKPSPLSLITNLYHSMLSKCDIHSTAYLIVVVGMVLMSSFFGCIIIYLQGPQKPTFSALFSILPSSST